MCRFGLQREAESRRLSACASSSVNNAAQKVREKQLKNLIPEKKEEGDDFSYSSNYQLWTSILPVFGLGRYATGIGTNWIPHVSVFLSLFFKSGTLHVN